MLRRRWLGRLGWSGEVGIVSVLYDIRIYPVYLQSVFVTDALLLKEWPFHCETDLLK